MEIYLPAKSRWDIAIHGWDKTTSGFGKQTAVILEFYLRFRFWRTCSHWHVILHLPAKFRSNRTICGGVMTSYRFFNMAAMKSEMYFRLQVLWRDLFKNVEMYLPAKFWWDISIHGWVNTTISENGRPPYWNSISGFDSDVYVYVTTWSTVDYTSVTSIIHCRHVVTFLFHDCDKLPVPSAAKRWVSGRCYQHVQITNCIIELVMLAATVVVHCTLIKRRENLFCSLVVLKYDISDNKNTNWNLRAVYRHSVTAA